MRCPSCQAPIRSEDVFCGSCGYKLTPQDRAGNVVPVAEQPSTFPPMPGPPPPQISPYSSPVQQVQVVQPTYDQASGSAVVTPQPAYPQTPSPVYSQAQQPVYAPAPQPSYGQAFPQAPQPKKKGLGGCVIALIVAAVLLLCGGLILGAILLVPKLLPQATPTVPVYQPPSDSGFSPSGADVPLDVVNNLSVSVCYLYVNPSDSDDWGGDWLDEIGTIPSGTSQTFWITSGEFVDLRAEDCYGDMLDEQYGVFVPAEGLTYTLNP